MNRIDRLRSVLEQALAPQQLEIRDDSAKHAGHAGAREGGHFAIHIVSGAFAGLTSLERHRLVYAAVAELMGRDIHALSISAEAPRPID